MPNLYLVRHGEARNDAPDDARALTERGASEVGRIAAWAARAEIAPVEIRHSGKRRAQQTAELFAASLHPERGVHEMRGIAPNDDPVAFAQSIAHESDAVLIVSHLPFLAHVVAALVGSELPVVDFHPATLVALVQMHDRFVIDCVVHPGVV